MLERLPIALAQVKLGNTSENVSNEFRNYYTHCIESRYHMWQLTKWHQTNHLSFLLRNKKTKKVYNNIEISIKV